MPAFGGSAPGNEATAVRHTFFLCRKVNEETRTKLAVLLGILRILAWDEETNGWVADLPSSGSERDYGAATTHFICVVFEGVNEIGLTGWAG